MSATPSVDVAVVGAGPAGAVTALLLARAGHRVALLDRREFPRAKPCGDCLSPEAGRVLDRLGLLEAVLLQRPARLEGWRITAHDGSSFTGGFEAAAGGDPRAATALALPRERFDLVLLQAAVRAGAGFHPGHRVEAILPGRLGGAGGVAGRAPGGEPFRLHARLVVGADGLRSVVARRLGRIRRTPRLRKLSLTTHVTGVRDAAALGELHLADGLCVGLAPLGPGARSEADGRLEEPLFNVTLVLDADRFARGARGDPRPLIRSCLARFPALRGRIPALEVEDDPRAPAPDDVLPSGPFDWPTRDVVTDGAALVGDAAGYYDPFTGQGIYQALAGAELLAEAADQALRSGDLSARHLRRAYARRHRRIIAPARRLQRLIEFVTAHPRLAVASVRRLAAAPAAAHALIAATGDLAPARSVLGPAAVVSFLFPQTSKEFAP